MASGPFTLAQLAQAVGMSVDDVRFYRDCGLLQPPRRQRSESGDIAFQDEHVERLRFIQRAIDHGFFLEDIERFVDEFNPVTCRDVQDIAVRRLAEYRRVWSSGHPTIVALERLVASCGGTGGRKDCQILGSLKGEPEGMDDCRAARRPDLTYFLYALDIAAEADNGFPREAMALVESAWQFPETRAVTFGWVIALKDRRRLYLEMVVTYLPGEAPIKLEIDTLDPEETYPTLEGAHRVFWYRPDHIDQHLGITGTSLH